MKKISIGSIQLGNAPVIAAVIDKELSLEEIQNLKKSNVELLELRFDLLGFSTQSAIDYIKLIRSNSSFGIIGTLRENKTNKDKRADYFKQIIPFLDAIDIEVDTDINKQVIEYAKDITVIVSHHDYEKTPSTKKLEEIADISDKLNADIVKIAIFANNISDVENLKTFSKKSPYNLVAIAMGELGKEMRIRAFDYNSLFTFGFIGDNEVAPGQLRVEELNIEIAKLNY